MDVLLLWLCSHLVDLLLHHAHCHHHCRVPVFPLQASAVLHHWSQGKPLHCSHSLLPSARHRLEVSTTLQVCQREVILVVCFEIAWLNVGSPMRGLCLMSPNLVMGVCSHIHNFALFCSHCDEWASALQLYRNRNFCMFLRSFTFSSWSHHFNALFIHL